MIVFPWEHVNKRGFMTEEERILVQEAVEYEGFHYAFMNYSDFRGVKDEQFHLLRKAFVKAAKELQEYIGEYEG